MKNPLMRAAQRNFTEIAYCMYLAGFHERITMEAARPLTFLEFCKNIKQLHATGKEHWAKNDGRNIQATIEEKNNRPQA